MKFNWGHGIAITLALFIGGMTTLVWGTFSQRIDLTSEDYYQQEVTYDLEREAINRALTLGELTWTESAGEIEIALPSIDGEWTDVQVHLLRFDNADMDLRFNPEAIDSKYIIERPTPGVWAVEVTAVKGGENYRWESNKRF